MSIFKGIGKFIAKLFLGDLFKNWFSDDNDDVLKNFTSYGVTIVQRFKLGLNDPKVKTVTDFLPGDWDLKIVDAAEVVSNKILDKLIEGQQCESKSTFSEKLSCYMAVVGVKEDFDKSKELVNFAGNISYELLKELKATDKIDINKLLSLVPAIFVELFGKKDAK